MFLRTF